MIAILDYGSGNLRSAQRAFAASGEDVQITSDPQICREAAGLVVPGVGAFQSCMSGLLQVHGDEIIRERVASERPTLGICIGMQILFEVGVEPTRTHIGQSTGVGVLPGVVSKLSAPILPHMGWNTVAVEDGFSLFRGIEEEFFYFVHSYAATENVGGVHAWSEYGGKFLAAVESGTLTATQFHPEKSGRAGLQLIENWIGKL